MAMGSGSVCSSTSRHCLGPPSNPIRFPRFGSENGVVGAASVRLSFSPCAFSRHSGTSQTVTTLQQQQFHRGGFLFRSRPDTKAPSTYSTPDRDNQHSPNARRLRGSVFPGWLATIGLFWKTTQPLRPCKPRLSLSRSLIIRPCNPRSRPAVREPCNSLPAFISAPSIPCMATSIPSPLVLWRPEFGSTVKARRRRGCGRGRGKAPCYMGQKSLRWCFRVDSSSHSFVGSFSSLASRQDVFLCPLQTRSRHDLPRLSG